MPLRSDDLAFGSDTARVQLLRGPGCGIVVCIDTSSKLAVGGRPYPRILVTLLLVNEQITMREEAKAVERLLQLRQECSLVDFFGSLPQYWTQEHLDCVRQCLLLQP
jgi:hypothetical protein